MKIGGREIVVTLFVCGVIILFVMHSLYRRNVMFTGNVQIHSNIEIKKDFMDTNKTTVRCPGFIDTISNHNMTDSTLLALSRACSKSGNTPPVGPKLFQNLFTNIIFNNIQCGEPEVGPNEGPALPLIALASFPGSGNTWTRVLLDQLTGIYTGSLGPCKMANSILKGSLLCPFSKVFIIKTHKKSGRSSGQCGVTYLDYESAIYILRNPYDAMIAEYNRKNAGKVGTVTKEMFQGGEWQSLVTKWTIHWREHVSYWLSSFTHPVHVLVYEDLVQNTLWELYKISKFINRPVTFRTMWCIQHRQTLGAAFKREKPDWLKAMYLFSNELKNTVNHNITELIPGVADKYGLKKTLASYLLY